MGEWKNWKMLTLSELPRCVQDVSKFGKVCWITKLSFFPLGLDSERAQLSDPSLSLCMNSRDSLALSDILIRYVLVMV